jgi:hypothetical protein
MIISYKPLIVIKKLNHVFVINGVE